MRLNQHLLVLLGGHPHLCGFDLHRPVLRQLLQGSKRCLIVEDLAPATIDDQFTLDDHGSLYGTLAGKAERCRALGRCQQQQQAMMEMAGGAVAKGMEKQMGTEVMQ